jgi:hypothetical protein
MERKEWPIRLGHEPAALKSVNSETLHAISLHVLALTTFLVCKVQSPSSCFSAISHRSSYRMGGFQQKLKEATITYSYSNFQQQQQNAMGIYMMP